MGHGNLPLPEATWDDAIAYTQWLSQQTGKRYRLPTEYSWGDMANHHLAHYRRSDSKEGDPGTAPVGSYPPNAFGLYDMHGNVEEWVQDSYAESYCDAPCDGSAVEITPNSGCKCLCDYRVVRGGGHYDDAEELRSAMRRFMLPFCRAGFRVAMDL